MKKKNIVLALALSLLAPIVAAAKTAEQAYIDSYASRPPGTLKPVLVISPVSPTLAKEWRGRTLEIVFVVDAHGRPRNIKSDARVPMDLMSGVTRAVSRWRFRPKLDANGKPVAAKVMLPVQIAPRGDRTPILRAAN